MHSLLFAALLFCPDQATCADQLVTTLSTPRFTLLIEGDKDAATHSAHVESIANKSLEILNENFEELSRIFAIQPTQRVVLRFLSSEEFHRQTGAPAWTSAMFFRGEITIPIARGQSVNLGHLTRALRHEYVHAVVAELSGNNCPAWLDEGLAQLIEGKPNPVLGPSLRAWLAQDHPMPLSWLENGFTTLDDELVPAAYGQSLFATRTLVNRYGFEGIRNYLAALRAGKAIPEAFAQAFLISQDGFEAQLAQQMKRWASGSSPQP